MTVEKSFMKTLTELMKKYPVLKQSNSCTVKIKVGSIVEIAQKFHASGYKDNDPFDFFNFKI